MRYPRFAGRALCLLAVVAAFLAPTSARAQSVGRLLFVDWHSGAYLTAGVDQLGKFHSSGNGVTSHFISAAAPKLVPTGSAIFYYVPAGQGYSFPLDAVNPIPITHVGGFASNWTTIVSLGDYLCFYDGAHTAALLAVRPDTSYTETDATSNFSLWSSLTTTDNYIVFYNATSGVEAVLTVASFGRSGATSVSATFQQTSNGTIGTGYSLFGTVGDDLVPYNRKTGAFEVDAIRFDGTQTDALSKLSAGKLLPRLDHVVTQDGYLVWYCAGTGAQAGKMVIGYIDRSAATGGSWVTTQTRIDGGFTDIVSAGHYLVLYSATTGDIEVGYITQAGKFVQTDTQTIEAGFIVTATKR